MKKKEKIFKEGVRNSVCFGTGEAYFCPMCGSPCNTENLTLEHVPQDSISGKEIILTCETCNNSSGHLYEYDLSKMFKQNEIHKALFGFLDETSEIHRVFFKHGDIHLNADLKKEIMPDGSSFFRIKMLKEHNNPEELRRSSEVLRQISDNKSPFEFSISTSKYNSYKKTNVETAYLKSAFLALTSLLGYSFAFSKHCYHIRLKILGRNSYDYAPCISYEHNGVPKSCILELFEHGSFLVSFEDALVFMPHPLCDISIHNRFLDTLKESGGRMTCNFVLHEFPTSFVGIMDRDKSVAFREDPIQ